MCASLFVCLFVCLFFVVVFFLGGGRGAGEGLGVTNLTDFNTRLVKSTHDHQNINYIL